MTHNIATQRNWKTVALPLRFAALSLLLSASAYAADWQTPQTAPTAPAPANIAAPAAEMITANGAKLYQISKDDVTNAIVEQLQAQGVEKKATATLAPFIGDQFYAADHPLQLVIHALQVDPNSHRWQAEAAVLSNHRTEFVKPVGGFYEAITSVPMLSKQTGRGDVIAATDIVMRDIPDRQLRKDTITDVQSLIGKSPRIQISPGRPIRTSELSNPIVIKRGEPVEMTYSTPYMNIKTTGIALDDGELGGMLRVKNAKSEKAVTAKVTGAGKVEANLDTNS